MAEQLHPGRLQKPKRFLHWSLFAFAVIIGFEAGAGAFTTVVVFPLWASSPEAAIGWTPALPCYLEEGDFFMYSSSLSMLVSLVTLIAGWRATPPLRMWVRMATLAFIFIFVWSVLYFVPIQDVTFKGEAGTKLPRAELDEKLQMFVFLNYIRQVILLFSFVSGLHALGLSYRMGREK